MGDKYVLISETITYRKLDVCFSRVVLLQRSLYLIGCKDLKSIFVLSCCLSTRGKGLWLIIAHLYVFNVSDFT